METLKMLPFAICNLNIWIFAYGTNRDVMELPFFAKKYFSSLYANCVKW